MRIPTLLSVLLIVLAGCQPEDPPTLTFIALGDAPYGDPEKTYPPYRKLIANINATDPNLVVHVGDTHGHNTCDDALLDQMRAFMNTFTAPVLYTPGDNEWTDCKYTDDGEFDPLDRLAYIRQTYFPNAMTLGQTPAPVENQAAVGYPENARFRLNNIGFITLHVVGSNNNFDPYDLSAVQEFMARTKADLDWLSTSFDRFDGADAIVVALHADMFVPQSGFAGFTRGWRRTSPYRDIGVMLGQRSSAFGKPVLLLYGDSHVQKTFQPFPKARPWLHAIEVFGYPDIKAIEIAIRPGSDTPFTVSQQFEP